MILHLVGSNVIFGGNFLRMTSEGIVVVIAEQVGDWSLALGNNNMINGLILSTQPSSSNFLIIRPASGTHMTINGAVHTKNARMRFEGSEPNAQITINNRPDILQIIKNELAGIINFSGKCEDVGDEITRRASFPAPTTEFLSRKF
jgi:hypothetical protein